MSDFNKIIPALLQKGDKVVVLSTARKIDETEIANAVSFYQSWGLTVVLGKTIGAEFNQFAGDDTLRLNDLQTALNDKEVKAIFCARGGYGTVRFLEQLDLTKFLEHPKWIVGYSDVTALHLLLNKHNVVTLHAEMPIILNNQSVENRNWSTLYNALFYGKVEMSFQSENQIETSFRKTILGGNLSVLYSLLGSKYLPNFKDAILFIEDIDEYLYHIDRMMQNVTNNGILNDIFGIAMGSFSKMNDNAIPFGLDANDIAKDYANKSKVKFINNLPIGHSEFNEAIFLNLEALFDTNKNGLTTISQTINY